MVSPTPGQVKQARAIAGLTQTAAGAILYTSCRAWQKWEKGEARMHQAMFELFLIKTGQNGNYK